MTTIVALTLLGGQVTIVEVLWFLMGLVGAFFAIGNLRHSMDDLDAIGPESDGVMRSIALGHARTEAGRTLIHATTMAIGIAAMLTPAVNPSVPISTLSVIILMGLFIINLVTILQSVLDKRLREAIEDEIGDFAQANSDRKRGESDRLGAIEDRLGVVEDQQAPGHHEDQEEERPYKDSP